MRKLIGLLLICLLLLVGCSDFRMPVSTPERPEIIAPETKVFEVIEEPAEHSVQAIPQLPSSIVRIEPPAHLEDRTWISPGKVMVGNFHAGARAEWILSVHNGSDYDAEFSVFYREAGHTGEEYVKAPAIVQEWVIVADPTPVIAPKATEDIMIALVMPEGALEMPPKFEFWVAVIDTSQTGMIRTALSSRWLVDMRVE